MIVHLVGHQMRAVLLNNFLYRVNPVSGYVEPERPSPFEGMSEEQKEHEAVKLANIIDRLHSLGVVKPGKLGKSIISERSFSD